MKGYPKLCVRLWDLVCCHALGLRHGPLHLAQDVGRGDATCDADEDSAGLASNNSLQLPATRVRVILRRHGGEAQEATVCLGIPCALVKLME